MRLQLNRRRGQAFAAHQVVLELMVRARDDAVLDFTFVEHHTEVRTCILKTRNDRAASREQDILAIERLGFDAAIRDVAEPRCVMPLTVDAIGERADETNAAAVRADRCGAFDLHDLGDFRASLLDGFLHAGMERQRRRRASIARSGKPHFDGRRRYAHQFDVAAVRRQHWPDAFERRFNSFRETGFYDAVTPEDGVDDVIGDCRFHGLKRRGVVLQSADESSQRLAIQGFNGSAVSHCRAAWRFIPAVKNHFQTLDIAREMSDVVAFAGDGFDGCHGLTCI